MTLAFVRSREMGDTGYTAFVAVFFILLGAACGIVFSHAEPVVMHQAEQKFQTSPVATTYDAVEQKVETEQINPMAAFGLFIAVLLINNVVCSALLAFNSRLLTPPLSAVVTAYMLFMNGAIAAAIGCRVAGDVSLAYACAAMLPHGIPEIAAMVTAGALGFWSLLHDDRARVRKVFFGRVVPLVAFAACVEVLVTPVLMLLAVR